MIDNYKDEIIPRKGLALYKDFFPQCLSFGIVAWHGPVELGKLPTKQEI